MVQAKKPGTQFWKGTDAMEPGTGLWRGMDAVAYGKELNISLQRRQVPESGPSGSQLGDIMLRETQEVSGLAVPTALTASLRTDMPTALTASLLTDAAKTTGTATTPKPWDRCMRKQASNSSQQAEDLKAQDQADNCHE